MNAVVRAQPRRRGLAFVVAVLTSLTAAGALPSPAAAATRCEEGDRDSAAAIAKEGAFDERLVDPVASADEASATVKLRYSAKYQCAWSLVDGPPGVTTWVDRWPNGAPSWDGPLGQRDVQSPNKNTYTEPLGTTGARVRACGNGFHREGSERRPAGIVCTGWYPPLDAQSAQAASAPTPPSPTAQLARQILELRADGKITISDYSEGKAKDQADGSLASRQLQDIAEGRDARLSRRCTYAAQLPEAIKPDPRILGFLADLGQQTQYSITVMFGQCHSGPGSAHHKGVAVDIGCTPELDLNKANAIGAKYGVRRNFETCTANQRWHYSVGGG